MPTIQDEGLLDTLKRVASALRESDVPFALGGGLAAWARGGPATEHDIDLVICEEDIDRALAALGKAGMRTERPPEGWLVKAWDGDILVDLIHQPTGLTVTPAFLEGCEERNVHAVNMRVLGVEDVLTTKLLALTEHHLDYGPLIEYARSLREQVDWRRLYERTMASPFARGFFCILAGLDICPPMPAACGAP